MEELDLGWATTSVCHSPKDKFIEVLMCLGSLCTSHLDLRTACGMGNHFISDGSTRIQTQICLIPNPTSFYSHAAFGYEYINVSIKFFFIFCPDSSKDHAS